jgi:hypothetical protein
MLRLFRRSNWMAWLRKRTSARTAIDSTNLERGPLAARMSCRLWQQLNTKGTQRERSQAEADERDQQRNQQCRSETDAAE